MNVCAYCRDVCAVADAGVVSLVIVQPCSSPFAPLLCGQSLFYHSVSFALCTLQTIGAEIVVYPPVEL